MSAPLPLRALRAAETHDQFVISYGKGGAVGLFTSAEPLTLRRGQCVIVETMRGLEYGTVLCAGSDRKATLLGAVDTGRLMRLANAADMAHHNESGLRERDLFETCRTLVAQSDIAIEILDVELLSDNAVAIVQFVGDDAATETCAHLLEERLHFAIRMENIAGSRQTDDEQHRCDKPDCGRQAGGGCSTCETGGGCSTCGSSKVDLREYFGHLRAKMEHAQRIPLT